MAVQIITDGDLALGGATVESSGGIKLSITVDTSGNLEIYSAIDGTPNLEVTETASGTFGGGAFGYIHAAIDSGDDIHLIAACTTKQTYDISYTKLTESGGAWTKTGPWENVANYSNAPTNPGVAISIDSNDKPHVLFVDNVKQAGSAQDNVYYTEKTGASWATPTQIGVRNTKTDYAIYPVITVRNSDYIEAWYRGLIDGTQGTIYRTYTTSWSTESQYPGGAQTKHGLTATTGGTVYRYHVEFASPYDIYENDTDTGYDTQNLSRWPSASLVGSDRYIFYIDTGLDVHLISNDGGGWTDEGALQTGTYEYVIAEWAYNNENQVDEINYIFEASGTVYWDSFSLAAGGGVPVPITSRRRRIKPMLAM